MPASPTDHEQRWDRQRLRIPREDETLLAIPPLHSALGLIRENNDALQSAQANVQGRSFAQLRQSARHEVLATAAEYTSLISGDNIAVKTAKYIVVGGHQPSLFHPGVWAKNFAIGALAAHTGGAAVNLVIDNDSNSSSGIRVPGGSREQPVYESIAFDAARLRAPWEEARILDKTTFRNFGPAVARHMGRWGSEPVAVDIWPDAVELMERSGMLRDALTAARCRLERRWGLANLELPISRLCGLDSFLWFASHVFAHLPRFRGIHNDALYEYRRLNRVRSRTHPVPDLVERDGWIEAPFWVWRAGDSQRNHMFAMQQGCEIHLSNGREIVARLPLGPEMDACCAVEELRKLAAQGFRFRTRALTTTLFARLFFADLFVHGIGGSKYDELTDRIIARFFNVPVPAFLTLTATLNLPLAKPHNVEPGDVSRLRQQLRDLDWNADRYLALGQDSAADLLIAEKRALVSAEHADGAMGGSRRERRERSRPNLQRYRRLREINGQLSVLAADHRARLEGELATIETELAANAVLKDREYSFCLYPQEKIRPFMTGLWQR